MATLNGIHAHKLCLIFELEEERGMKERDMYVCCVRLVSGAFGGCSQALEFYRYLMFLPISSIR